jgi:hypothetical protein
LKADVNVPSKSKKQKNFDKNFVFDGILAATVEKAGSESEIQGYGSADPDPYQNVTDP